MKKPDARTLLPETQEHLRRQAIRLRKNGNTYRAIAEIVGVHRNSRSPARDAAGLKKKVRSHMTKLQKLPNRVKKYFQHPKIAYAA